MNIILSIKPEWAAKIYSGEKIIEWRKTRPKKFRDYDRVFLYETAPVKKITGFLELYGITKKEKPEKLSKHHPLINLGCVDKKELEKYSGGKSVYAWIIKKTVRFRSEDLKEIGVGIEDFGLKKAPQSWVYCKKRRFKNG